ncbi:aminoglycoside phosphotransferase family protein [Candidatus Sumerlaeota bacterium]|nr:aminoglycoside phosphotransferase family protein [Candidatus Sumerlaeota bacterium]
MGTKSLHAGFLESALKVHIRDQICKPRQWDLDACRLEIPLRGRKSLVRILVAPDGEERLVLRLGLGAAQNRECHAMRIASDLLVEHGIPTPRVIALFDRFGRRSAVLIHEEFIPGRTLEGTELTPPVIDALAQTLGRLHAVRSPQWGEPRLLKRHGYSTAAIGRFANRLRSLAIPAPLRPPRSERRAISQWARAWGPALEGLGEHSLKHGKLNAGNVMITPDGRAVLIDLESVHWGSAAKDLAQLRHEVFEDREEDWRLFRERHRRIIGDELAEEIDRVLPFFEVYHHVAECAIAMKRLRRAAHHRGVSPPLAPEKIHRHWAEALAVVESHPAPAPAEALRH